MIKVLHEKVFETVFGQPVDVQETVRLVGGVFKSLLDVVNVGVVIQEHLPFRHRWHAPAQHMGRVGSHFWTQRVVFLSRKDGIHLGMPSQHKDFVQKRGAVLVDRVAAYQIIEDDQCPTLRPGTIPDDLVQQFFINVCTDF